VVVPLRVAEIPDRATTNSNRLQSNCGSSSFNELCRAEAEDVLAAADFPAVAEVVPVAVAAVEVDPAVAVVVQADVK